MFSKTLIKLIDSAIFPAVVIVTAKIVGVAFLSNYFQINYQVDGLGLKFYDTVDFLNVNSYSSLFMFCAVMGGLIWVVIKAHAFHDTHIKPSFSAKLLDMNLIQLVNKSDVIYSESFVWLSYAWLSTIIFGAYSLYVLSYVWVFALALCITIVATALLIIDVERELKAGNRTIIKYNGGEDMQISIGNQNLVSITDLSKELTQ